MPTVQCPKCGLCNELPPFGYMTYAGRWKCENCGINLRVSIVAGQLQRTPEVLDVVMVEGADPEVSSDFTAAQKCLTVDAHKAAVVMCRRSLEGMALSMGAKGKNLFEKLEDLYQKGLISQRNFEIATQVRQFGNYGAHLNDDLLGGITADDAQTIVEITHLLLRDAYEVPRTIDKLKNRLGK